MVASHSEVRKDVVELPYFALDMLQSLPQDEAEVCAGLGDARAAVPFRDEVGVLSKSALGAVAPLSVQGRGARHTRLVGVLHVLAVLHNAGVNTALRSVNLLPVRAEFVIEPAVEYVDPRCLLVAVGFRLLALVHDVKCLIPALGVNA